MGAMSFTRPLLACRFCGEGFYPDQEWKLRAHESTCKPWERELDVGDCTCVHTCAEDPASACSLSGDWHVHPDDGRGIFGPCPVHPDAPGDH